MYNDRRLRWLFSHLIVLTHKTNDYTTHQLHTPNTFNVKSLTFQTRHHSQNFPLFLSNHMPRVATSFLIGSCGTFCNQWKKSVCFSLEGFSPPATSLRYKMKNEFFYFLIEHLNAETSARSINKRYMISSLFWRSNVNIITWLLWIVWCMKSKCQRQVNLSNRLIF